jgi:hypothetical protein
MKVVGESDQVINRGVDMCQNAGGSGKAPVAYLPRLLWVCGAGRARQPVSFSSQASSHGLAQPHPLPGSPRAFISTDSRHRCFGHDRRRAFTAKLGALRRYVRSL